MLSRAGVCQGYVTWGDVSRLLQFIGPHLFFEGDGFFFEGDGSDPAYLLDTGTYYRGTLDMIPIISLWCFWKVRCMHVLSAEPSSTSDTLRLIRSKLLHTLRS